MYCSACGTQLAPAAKFCSKCGQSANGNFASAGEITADHTPTTSPKAIAAPAAFGTKWLKFWNYFSLPVGGVLGLLMSLGVPALGIIMVPIAVLQFAVAYGLHNRKIWAWRWNWVVIVLTWFSGAIPNSFGSSVDFWAKFVILVPVFGLVWMWPNYVYWKKRRLLFS
jgi:hypothetical protein